VAAAWILLIALLIYREPPPGAADPQTLATALSTAYRERNPVQLERLLAQPSEDAAGKLLEACGGAVTHVRPRGAESVELVTADGRGCRDLPIQRHDGRWYVDLSYLALAPVARALHSSAGL
jgi:hypothetical protein